MTRRSGRIPGRESEENIKWTGRPQCFLYVGRLAKEKNGKNSWSTERKFEESGTILMIGAAVLIWRLYGKKAAELGVTGSVIFTGMVSPAEVASYYPAGDLFVSASTSETQGLTMRKHWQQDYRYYAEGINACGRLWKREKTAGSTGPKRNS